MSDVAYYVAVFTKTSWRLFQEAGADTAAFPLPAWARVAKLNVGDYLLCYIVEAKQWIGLLRVTGRPYRATEPPIWGVGFFPSRISVEVIEALNADTAVSAKDIIWQIPKLRNAESKQAGAWAGFLRPAPRRWLAEDANVVIDAIRQSSQVPAEVAESPKRD
jgi:hypothetical protein